MQKNTLKLLWSFSNYSKVKRNLAIILPIFAVLTTSVLAPYILSLFINRLQSGNVTLDNSWGTILLYGSTVFIGEVILWRTALYLTWTFEVDSQKKLYLAIFRQLAHKDISFHANRFGGSLISQSTKLIGSFERFWDMIIWSIIPMLTTIIGSIVALTILGLWPYSIFLVIYTIVFIIIVIFGSKFLAERNRAEAEASNTTNGYLADMVTNVATVKAFGNEQHEQHHADRRIEEWRKKSFRLKWGVLTTTSAFSTMYTVGAVAALFFAVVSTEHGIASIGIVYLVLTYALNINRQVWEMNSISRTYNRIIGDAHDMTQILLESSTIVDNTATKLLPTKGSIDFNTISFTHDNGMGIQVFSGLSLNITPGQRIGLVGHSGSGKTTLTRLLLRFSDIDSGTVSIDNQDISQVTQQSLHHAISYVPQDPLLFHRSLRENIAYGKPNASDKEILHAAEQAHALEFIEQLPQGLDTMVGERGVKLSGGQRQRIAIARAILKDAPILVLDEATSALDSESEKLIQQSLETLMKNRTSIVIAHRLSTIAKLDRIIVLDHGKIVEDGSHAKLIKQKGIYASLWNHQSGGFIEES